MFKVLVACEESQRVTLYLRERERERLTHVILLSVVGSIQSGI